MTSAVFVAVLVFLASVVGGAALWYLRRERAGFALLVLAPVVSAIAATVVLRSAQAIAVAPHGVTNSTEIAAVHNDPLPPADRASVAPVATVAMRPAAGSQLDALRGQAAQLRAARRFDAARDVYAQIVKASPDDPDAWADLADASAAAANGDLGAGAVAINRALQVDPAHPKALWLKASLELQLKHYGAAESLWRRLLTQLPKDSEDARIVSANLEEARTLQSGNGAAR